MSVERKATSEIFWLSRRSRLCSTGEWMTSVVKAHPCNHTSTHQDRVSS